MPLPSASQTADGAQHVDVAVVGAGFAGEAAQRWLLATDNGAPVSCREALATAGVPVEQLQARGHFHSSFAMVDVVATGVSGGARMAEALRRFAGMTDATDSGKAMPKAAE